MEAAATTAGTLRLGPASATALSGRADALPSTRLGFLPSNFGPGFRSYRPAAGHQRRRPSSSSASSWSLGSKGRRRAWSVATRASASSDDYAAPFPGGSADKVAPLQLESPVGQLLSQILVAHPHLLPAAVDQQLEQLQTDREAQESDDPPNITGTDLVLYRRISELKATERSKAVEEILYTLVVQRFMDAGVQLTPAVAQDTAFFSPPPAAADEAKLQGVHSPEAAEMIDNHLRLVLGQRLADPTDAAQISRLRVGQVYAASVMYGYFLKRVDHLFQLEKRMKTLPPGVMPDDEDRADDRWEYAMPPPPPPPSAGASSGSSRMSAGTVSPGGFGFGIKHTPLRAYVMSFDPDTLQECANVRSKEAVAIIEKHTEALFGRAANGGDQIINISIGGLKKLVLEAVAFGSFLWEVETFVDSRYHFVTN